MNFSIIDFFQKYLLLFLLIANMTAEYIIFMPISKMLFYLVLGVSVFFMLGRKVLSLETVSKCSHIYILGGILIAYQMFVGYGQWNTDSVTYLAGKLATFAIMVLCVISNYEFYLKKSILPISYLILALIVLGWFVNRTYIGDELVFGFANRNAACAIAAIGFAGFLFGKDKLNRIDYFALSILFLSVLLGGSRNSLAMCIIFIIVRYGFSKRLAIILIGAFLLVFVIFPILGIHIVAIDRLLGTITGEVAIDREDQRLGAFMMIEERPWTGWGLGSHVQGRALDICHYLSTHNGYLTILMYMGIPLGVLFIGTIIIGTLSRLRLYLYKESVFNYHLAVMVSILFAANQEEYLVGVNQISTNLFFVSFVVTGYTRYYESKGLIMQDVSKSETIVRQ